MHNDKTFNLHVISLTFTFFSRSPGFIECFHIWNFWRWHKLSPLGLEVFCHNYRYIYWRPTIRQPDQFDLCQGHSSNRHIQMKSMDFHLTKHIVLRPLGLGVPHQTCGHLKWIVQCILKIRPLRHHFWILWVKDKFSHYNQRDSQMSINQ